MSWPQVLLLVLTIFGVGAGIGIELGEIRLAVEDLLNEIERHGRRYRP